MNFKIINAFESAIRDSQRKQSRIRKTISDAQTELKREIEYERGLRRVILAREGMAMWNENDDVPDENPIEPQGYDSRPISQRETKKRVSSLELKMENAFERINALERS